ncbi:hypothetical protein QTH91_06645 [Variovorax dokdonensis]|uniref:Uncharacterized protein n=1 Tax=Variovorax dokdonensis TaxID=344883 RepID=A0ABT7N897_9BURK|nr:hypothetical protein [Variovorax dokdonensis]MDM0044154.1 hypothetical protein [Variovorax dokdonensis]
MIQTASACAGIRAATFLMALAGAGMSFNAWSQPSGGAADSPQQRYERQLAVCNSGKLPEPERDACVRDAGRMLDQALGGRPGNVTTTTEDGRATVVSPAGLPVPNSGSDQVRSRDGRSTIVVPADMNAPK